MKENGEPDDGDKDAAYYTTAIPSKELSYIILSVYDLDTDARNPFHNRNGEENCVYL